MKLSERSLNYGVMKMLTVKQDDKRIVNPDIDSLTEHIATKEELFKMLVAECGFIASHRNHVWTHTKDDKFSVQLDPSKGIFLFEYRYTTDQVAYSPPIGGGEFISRFLESSRNFFHKVVVKPTE
jgi:hypothetical protein